MLRSYVLPIAMIAACVVGTPGEAAIVGVTPNASFAKAPYTVSLFGGDASYTFSALSYPVDTLYRQDALSTTGGATAYGGGFIGNGTDYTTYSAGSATPGNNFGGDFISALSPRAIDYSLTDGYLSLAITANALTYYGYAEIDGTSLVRLAYNSVAGAPITTGESISAVPETATWAMMILGLGLVGGLMRRRPKAGTRISYAV